MRIQHNIMAMSAYRNYTNNVSAMKKNLEKLSSGYKINRAGDDAAGLAISEKMRAQITGLETAQKNAKDGISLIQTAEGALTEVHDMLNRMVSLATQSANGTYDNEVDRTQMQKEIEQLKSEINRIADASNFNGIKLLDGTLGMNTDAFQVTGYTDAIAGKVISNGAAINSTVVTTVNANDRASKTVLHKSGTEATGGKFTVDLSALTADVAGKTGSKIQLKVGNVVIASVASTALGATGTHYDGIALASLAFNALTGSTKGIVITKGGAIKTGGTAANTGALFYKAEKNGDGTITFTATKYGQGTSWKTLANGVMNNDVASAAAKKLNMAVAVSGVTGKLTIGSSKDLNLNNLATTDVHNPTKPTTTQLASTIVALDMSKIKDGSQLTIGNKTLTFAIGANSKYKDADNVVDLTDFETLATTGTGSVDTGDKEKEVMARITAAYGNEARAEFTVGNNGGTYGELTVYEKGDGTGGSNASEETQKHLETKDGFQSLISLKDADTAAGTKLAITGSKIKEGDTLTINGKQFVFTMKDSMADSGNVNYVKIASDGSDALTQLTSKLNAAGFNTGTVGTDFVIYGDTSGAYSILGKGLTLQIGDTAESFNQLNVAVSDAHTTTLGIDGIDIGNPNGAADAIDLIKSAINKVSDIRGSLGATQNRLDHTINNLSVMTENIQDAESTIRDTDVAAEMMEYTKNNILIQSAQAMLAQANQVPQGVLQLLQ